MLQRLAHPIVNDYNQVTGAKWNNDLTAYIAHTVAELSRPVATPTMASQVAQVEQRVESVRPTYAAVAEREPLPTSDSLHETSELDSMSSVLPALETLSTDELEQLLSDEIALHEYVSRLNEVGGMQAARDESVKSNFIIANATLDKRPQLDELHRETEELELQLGKLEAAFREKVLNLQVAGDSCSPEAALVLFRQCSAHLEDASVSSLEDFRGKKLEVRLEALYGRCEQSVRVFSQVGDFVRIFSQIRRLFNHFHAAADLSAQWSS